jgi:hypothetical protein
MDTMSVQSPKCKLLGKWDLYYHLPHDSKWDLSSYTVILGDIDYAEKVIAINEAISESLLKSCMFFVMKHGITPMWEDAKNRLGGCFSYKVVNKQVGEVWKTLFYMMCGETLTKNKSHNQHINGITISPKKNFCIVKIWLDTTNFQDPTFISQIPNLPTEGCLFKKHAPEF